MPVYEYHRPDTATNFSAKASKLSTRFSTNYRLRTVTLNSITNNGNQINVDVSASLNRWQQYRLKKLVNRCFEANEGNSSDEEEEAEAENAPVTNNDVIDGFKVGSRWTDKVNQKTYICLDNTEGSAVWQDISTDSTIIYATDTNYYYNYPVFASSTTWLNISSFPFKQGTKINELQCVVKLDNASITAEIQLYNSKNGDVLCTINFTGSEYIKIPTYINSTSFNNIPTVDSTLSIRIRRVSGSGSIRHYSFRLS